MKVGLRVENNVASMATTSSVSFLFYQQTASPQCGADINPGGDDCPAATKCSYDTLPLWLLLLLATELTVYSYKDLALSPSSFHPTGRAAAPATASAATCSFTLFGWKMELSAVHFRLAPGGPVLRGTAGLLLEDCLLLRPSHQRSSGWIIEDH